MAKPWNSRTWLADDLITTIKNRARVPDTNDYPDATILELAEEALLTVVNDPVFTARGGRDIYRTTYDITADALDSNGEKYAMPPFATAETINNVVYVDTSSTPNAEYDLNYIEPGQWASYRYSPSASEGDSPWGYTIEGHVLRIFPRPTSDPANRDIRIVYARRPAKLVVQSSCRTVTAIADAGSSTTTLTLDSAPPAAWIDDETRIDITEPFAPHRLQFTDALISNISGSDITVAIDYAEISVDTVINPDSSVSASGENCYLQTPLELKKVLVDQAASMILREIGDDAGADRLLGNVARDLPGIANMLEPRVKAQRAKCINRNGLMRGGRRSGRTWGR